MPAVALQPPEAYQPALQARYAQVAARLARLWPGGRVEHVGASSVPGAWSKGDLDVLLAVPAAQLEAARAALVAAGYREKADTLRTAELCMLEGAGHAVQLVAAGSRFEALFLGFRDRLRADPTLRAAYNALKQRHAGAGMGAYRDAKQAFIEAALAAPPPHGD